MLPFLCLAGFPYDLEINPCKLKNFCLPLCPNAIFQQTGSSDCGAWHAKWENQYLWFLIKLLKKMQRFRARCNSTDGSRRAAARDGIFLITLWLDSNLRNDVVKV